MANIELLKRLRTRFMRMRHPEHFSMKVVADRTDCGTVMCIAGHALDLQGYRVTFKPAVCGVDCCGHSPTFFTPEGKVVNAPMRAAARELGLNYARVAKPLFHDFGLQTPKDAAKRIEQLIEKYSDAKA